MSDTIRNWTVTAAHRPMERARLLAEVSLADISNARPDMIERVAFRIADVLEKYQALDFQERMDNMPIANPLQTQDQSDKGGMSTLALNE